MNIEQANKFLDLGFMIKGFQFSEHCLEILAFQISEHCLEILVSNS